MGAAMKRSLLALFLFICASFGAAEAASRFAVCTVTCTWDGASTAMWSTTTGGGTGASVPGSGDTAIFDGATCVGGVTCTITVNTNPTIQQITFGACTASTTGCILDFSVNNNNVTLSNAYSNSGTGTRTLKMGSGTWSLTGGGATIWDQTTGTNLTFDAGTSTIVFSGNSATTGTVALGSTSVTYNNITFNGAALGGGWLFTAGANQTMAALSIGAPNTLFFTTGSTYTISSIATSGGSALSTVALLSNNTSNNSTISDAAGSNTIDFSSIRRITFSGGATFAATNSYNLGANSGITITGPSGGGRCTGC